MKGFLQGSLWGVILGVSGLSVASLVNERPDFAEGPPAPQIVVPEMDVVAPGPEVAFDTSSDEAPQFTAADPLESAQEVSNTPPIVSATPAELPQTADVTAAINSPAATPLPGMESADLAPEAPRAETPLTAPETQESAPSVDTLSAQAPEVPAEEQSEVAEVTDAEPQVAAKEPAAEPVTEAPVETTVAEQAEVPAEVVETVEATLPATEDATEEAETIVAQETVVEAPVSEEAPESVTSSTDDGSAPTETETTDNMANQTAEADTEMGGAAGQSVAAEVAVTEVLPQTSDAVRINRPDSTDPATDDDMQNADDAAAVPDDAPALLRYAVPTDAGDARSQIAIVLIDEGEMADQVEAVSALPFVPTVAVNAFSPTAAQLTAIYRTSGIEVAMQAQLPDGAQPTDAEVAFEAALGMMPRVAMLFSDGTGAIQDRAVLAQVMQILAADGYGFVTVQRGLSNAARAAEQAGVAGATIFRDIDGSGENVQGITLALNQAAFRARQSGQAILLGRVTPNTLEALKIWADDLDQSTLAIVPASAILLQLQ